MLAIVWSFYSQTQLRKDRYSHVIWFLLSSPPLASMTKYQIWCYYSLWLVNMLPQPQRRRQPEIPLRLLPSFLHVPRTPCPLSLPSATLSLEAWRRLVHHQILLLRLQCSPPLLPDLQSSSCQLIPTLCRIASRMPRPLPIVLVWVIDWATSSSVALCLLCFVLQSFPYLPILHLVIYLRCLYLTLLLKTRALD